jgi:hypothetical protein
MFFLNNTSVEKIELVNILYGQKYLQMQFIFEK